MRGSGEIAERLMQVRLQLLAVATGIPEELWQKQPAPGRWSAAEVIAHLTMVEAAVVEKAAKRVATEPRPVPLWRRLHIPPKLAEWRFKKVKTPVPLDPALLGEKQAMLERFAAVRQRTLAFLEANAGRDLRRWRWRHAIFGSLNGDTWLKSLGYHEIRHTKQLREIVGSL